MNIIERAKNILITPKTEWEVIKNENDSHSKVLTSYLIWLALIPTVAIFIGYGIIGYNILGFHYGSISWGIKQAIIQLITVIGGAYLTAFIFNAIAPSQGGKQNFNKAFQLAAYCYTAMCVGGIFYIYHSLQFLASIASLYSLYLLYIGIKPMMEVPDDKRTTYFIISLLAMVGVALLVGFVLSAIIIGGTYGALSRF